MCCAMQGIAIAGRKGPNRSDGQGPCETAGPQRPGLVETGVAHGEQKRDCGNAARGEL